MNPEENDAELNLAAIVCVHVATESRPILKAERDKPMAPEDSGWQFMCNGELEEDIDEAQVWAVAEVLEFDPSLVGNLDFPAGSKITRDRPGEPWKKFES